MTVSCPDCRSVFRIDPAKVPATGVRARCSVCGGIILVPGAAAGVPQATGATVVRGPTGTTGPAGGELPAAVASVPPTAADRLATPATSVPPYAAPAAPVTRPVAPPVAAPSPAVSTPASAVFGVAGVADPRVPVRETPSASDVPRASVTPDYRLGAVTPRTATPAAAPGGGTRPSPWQALPPATPVTATPVTATPVTATPVTATPVTATPVTATPVTATPVALAPSHPAGSRRPVNPFLNADPSQRARRLARALVSDLVAYHPRKREEGLAQGTLRQLFREDIKRSYEEYLEQVGREVAEGTPYFQEALNDLLAGGQRLF
jgi:predicted Zn finger-like uncharacterized protein